MLFCPEDHVWITRKSLKGDRIMFSKKIRIFSFCLALVTCLLVVPFAAFGDECAVHTYVETVIEPATTVADGTVERVCSVCGHTETETVPAIALTTLRASSVSFKDKAQVPEIIVEDINGNPIGKEYYIRTVTDGNGREVPYGRKIGKYTITLTFTGKYAGEAELRFNIVPVPVEGVSAHATAEGKISVSFTKLEGAKGYEIYYSKHKNRDFKRLGKTTSTSFTSKALTPGRTYYVKVRAYQKGIGGTVYGKFSEVKSVVIP